MDKKQNAPRGAFSSFVVPVPGMAVTMKIAQSYKIFFQLSAFRCNRSQDASSENMLSPLVF